MSAKLLLPGWRRVRLGDVLRQVDRFEAVDPNREYRLLGVRWYANGCHLHSSVRGRELKTPQLATARVGDVTYNKMWTSKGAFGVIQAEQDGFAATSEYPLFVPRNGDVDPQFLACVFSRPRFWQRARALCKGTTQRARLNPADFLRIDVDLPAPDYQRRAVAAVQAVDHAISANEELVLRMAALKTALTDELLSKGLPSRRSALKPSELGEVPADWEVHALKELAAVQTGLAKNKAEAAKGAIEVPYLRVANVQDGFVSCDDLKRIRVKEEDIERYGLQRGDVLMTEGGDNDKLGRGCVWEGVVEPCIHQNHVFAVRCGPRINPEFLALFSASSRGRRYFKGASKQTTNLASINSTQLKQLPVPVPPPAEQSQIGSIVAEMRRAAAQGKALVEHLACVRSQLIESFVRKESHGHDR